MDLLLDILLPRAEPLYSSFYGMMCLVSNGCAVQILIVGRLMSIAYGEKCECYCCISFFLSMQSQT